MLTLAVTLDSTFFKNGVHIETNAHLPLRRGAHPVPTQLEDHPLQSKPKRKLPGKTLPGILQQRQAKPAQRSNTRSIQIQFLAQAKSRGWKALPWRAVRRSSAI